MLFVLPVNVNFGKVSKNFMSKTESVKPSVGAPTTIFPVNDDVTKKFSQKEIKNILKKAGTYQKSEKKLEYYKVSYDNKSRAFIINDACRTNNTTVIYESGIVRHRGSWHIKDAEVNIVDGKLLYDHMKRRIAGNI